MRDRQSCLSVCLSKSKSHNGHSYRPRHRGTVVDLIDIGLLGRTNVLIALYNATI